MSFFTRCRSFAFGVIALALIAMAHHATADIYEWAYIDPAQPHLGKQESAMLTPDGAGVMPGAGVDLRSLDLTMAYLVGSDLSQANLAHAQLPAADLSGATLFDANLHNVTASSTTFSGANLREAYLGAADLIQADLTNADLRNAYLSNADLQGADFSGARIEGVNLGPATRFGWTESQLHSTASYVNGTLDRIDFGASDLSGWDLSGQSIADAVFFGATLARTNFNGSSVVRANFANPHLDDATFVNSDLSDAWFQHGTARRADFAGATLVGSSLSGDVTDAIFRDANLTNARMGTATVTGADFENAIVAGASLRGGPNGGLTAAQLYSTASYRNRELQRLSVGDDASGWNFAQQDLTEASFSYTNLAGATFANANLPRANLQYTRLSNADFSDANLTDADFYRSEAFENVNLSRANLTGASLEQVDLSTANFTNAEIEYAKIPAIPHQSLYSTASYQRGQLRGVRIETYDSSTLDLSTQDLRGATLGGWLGLINLAGAGIRGMTLQAPTLLPGDPLALTPEQIYATASYQAQDMEGVVFRIRTLPSIDFSGQNLAISTFETTDHGNSNFSGADLRGAVFPADPTRTRLPAQNLVNTIFPDGSVFGLNLTESRTLVVRDHDGGTVAGSGRIGPRYVPPTPIMVQDEFVMDESGTLVLRFDDDEWDSTISFARSIPVQLGGTLQLTFADGVNVLDQVGRTFDVFIWPSVAPSGRFAVESDYVWDLSNLYSLGEITLVAVPEPAAIGIALVCSLALLVRHRGG